MMRITTRTDTLLIAKCGPRYFIVLFGLAFIIFSLLPFSDGFYAGGILTMVVGVALMAFNRRWRLVIDKQGNTITVHERNITGLRSRDLSAALDKVLLVTYYEFGPLNIGAATCYVDFLVDESRSIRFGASRPHYGPPIIGGFLPHSVSKEEMLALEIARFMGVEFSGYGIGTEKNSQNDPSTIGRA